MTYKKLKGKSFALICNQGSCKFTEHFADNEEAYRRGWRMESGSGDHICPSCMEERNALNHRILRSNVTIAIDTPLDDDAFTARTAEMFEKLDATIKEFFPDSEIFGNWVEDG